MLRHITAWLLGVCLLAAGTRAFAGGVEVGDQGAKAAGRGGAFSALADDFTAVDYNPAGLARIRGTHFFFNHRSLYQDIEYRRARTLDWSEATHGVPELLEFEHVRPDDPWFLQGVMFGITTDLGLDDFGFAAGLYGPPAVGAQSFPEDGPQKYMLTNMEVMIIYYTVSAAWKKGDVFGFGASLQWVDCPKLDFELVVDGNIAPKIVQPDESPFDIRTRISGEDRVGFTAIAGGWYKPHPRWEAALSGRVVPIHIRTDSKLSVVAENLTLDSPPEITKDGVPDNRVHFTMDMPVKLRGGARYVHPDGAGGELFDVELDFGYDLWSVMEQYTLDAGVTVEVMGHQVPIDKMYIKKMWKDSFSVHLGGDFQVVHDVLRLRAGVFYETPSFDTGAEYLDAFPFERIGPSAGFTLRVLGSDLSVAYTWVHQIPRTVSEDESKVFQQTPGSPCQAPYTDTNVCADQYLGKPSASANAGTYVADYHLVNASLSMGF